MKSQPGRDGNLRCARTLRTDRRVCEIDVQRCCAKGKGRGARFKPVWQHKMVCSAATGCYSEWKMIENAPCLVAAQLIQCKMEARLAARYCTSLRRTLQVVFHGRLRLVSLHGSRAGMNLTVVLCLFARRNLSMEGSRNRS